MAEINYIANRDIPENIAGVERYSTEDTQLISSFEVNSSFDTSRHVVELHLLSLSDEILFSEYDYRSYKQLGNAQSAGQVGASVLTIDPIQDSISFDYGNGGVKLLYHFLNDLFTDDTTAAELYIQDISPDRTELKLASLTLSPTDLERFTTVIKDKLNNEAFFNEFRLNFGDNDLLIGINIDTLDNVIEKEVTVKLYEPLPFTYGIKSKLRVVELVADSLAYEVQSETTPEPVVIPTLKPANFNIEIQDENIIPTQYFNYDELFSYPINNTNSQLFSLVNEKGVEISIDHTSYSDFIHFSSAQERLINFKYKLDLITSYSASLSAIGSQTPSTQGVIGLQGISGSRTYFEGLMEGVLNNLDHYERFLYYESGSSSWPKTNTSKPYQNKVSTTPESILWYSNQVAEAISYDNTNYNSLIFSIPSYLREDVNNENYLTFIHMIGQHFDNLWLYADAVTDKYDADNRMNKGISKDLVGEALKNFGVKLYTSNKSIEDLFSSFIGQGYVSGSEIINNYITGSLTGSNTPIEPSSFDTYEKEIQKRIYHNLSYLLKTKGTERGLRALINCFGIPSSILDIKLYGGRDTNERPFYGDYQYYTSSLDKIRIDHTGSIISGSTLSSYTSIVKRDNKYTDDLHVIEVGFSPTDNVDRYIISKSLADPNLATFNIDDYIGNPSNLLLPNYDGLYAVAEDVLGDLSQYDVRAFIRLIKFFDNVIFKMVKDFIPARTVADTGIIIKPNLLNRSKTKSITPSVTPIASASMDNAFNYTSSIDTAFVEGKNGGSFRSGSSEYSTNHRKYVKGLTSTFLDRSVSDESPKFTGELTGSQITLSTGELNTGNLFKQTDNSRTFYNVQLYTTIPNTVCLLTNSNTSLGIVNGGAVVNFSEIFPLANAGTQFSVNSTVVQGGSYTFPSTQYATYNITANTPGLFTNPPTNTIPCSTQRTIQVIDCTIVANGTAPLSIDNTTSYNITLWFNTGTNTNVNYFVNGQQVLNPATYIFTGIGSNQTVAVTAADAIRTSCVAEVRVSTNPCQIRKVSTVVGSIQPPHGTPTGYNIVQDYFTGDNANTNYYFRLIYTNYNSEDILVTQRTDNTNIGGWLLLDDSHKIDPWFPMADAVIDIGVENTTVTWPALDALEGTYGLNSAVNFQRYFFYRNEIRGERLNFRVQFRADASTAGVPNCIAETTPRLYNSALGNSLSYPIILTTTNLTGPNAFYELCFFSLSRTYYTATPIPTSIGTSRLEYIATQGLEIFTDINKTIAALPGHYSDSSKIYKYYGFGEWSNLGTVSNSCSSYPAPTGNTGNSNPGNISSATNVVTP